MEARDGFITGISDYCDQWCETCAFTSHCRLFADLARTEVERDPNLKALIDAPPLPQGVPPPPPAWMQELMDEMNEAASAPVADMEHPGLRPRVSPDHESIRSHEYGIRIRAWLKDRGFPLIRDPADPRAVTAWSHTLVPAKVFRALAGLARDIPEERDGPPDHDGSAKVALLGLDRSHVAWLQLVDRGLASRADVEPLVTDVVGSAKRSNACFRRASVRAPGVR
jgi:hypothetical protein